MHTLIGLQRRIANGDNTPLDIRVAGGGFYPGMVMIYRCCELKHQDGWPAEIRIVAQGKPNLYGELGPGPFVFIYPAKGVNPDQPAHLGMPISSISF